MKKIITSIVLIFTFTLSSYATSHKTIRITDHAAIIDALSSVKSSCESIRDLVDSKWPDATKAQMAILYTHTKQSSDQLISAYEVIIPQWRYAMKHKVDVTKQLKDLQSKDSVMVTYFEANYAKYNSGAGLAVTTEIIDLVFDAGTKIYQFVKNINTDQQNLYKSQVEDQRITVEFNGKNDTPNTPTVKSTNPKDSTTKSNSTPKPNKQSGTTPKK